MNKHHPYQNIIERKLEQLPAADENLLWNEMHTILDKKMPQKKEGRRFIFWFFMSSGFLLLALTIGSVLFFLPGKKNSTVAIKKSSSIVSDDPIKDETVKISQERKEAITTATKSNKETEDNIFETTPTSATNNAIDNNFISQQTIKPFEKNKTDDLLNQPIPSISDDNSNSDIASDEIRSAQQDILIKPKHNEEESSIDQQPEVRTYNMKKNGRNRNENGLYGGIVSGVDLSSIHFRSVRQGVTKGLILGYAFNRKWSIESGLLWDTKRVYDNGNHFNPPGYMPTNGVKITTVNGKSRLYEWPINVKYNIISGKNGLFATAGMSSYLMRVENYDYEYTQNNQPGGHNYLSYTNETKNWFSVVNFSIGYTHKLDRIGDIRIEPYIKLPVKNIGIGKMPIMSTGLNIGFTKTLK